MADDLTVEWFGCTTFRVCVAGLTLWFDTFVDRAPGAAPVGLTAEAIDTADFVFVSHAHFDHALGADTVALATGAPVVGNFETVRLLAANGVAAAQRWAVSGGETVDCGRGVRVRVFPSLHSCLFASSELDAGTPCLGDLGISLQDRRAKVADVWPLLASVVPPAYAAEIEQHTSHEDGGQLSYLIESADGSIFVSASSGYWSGILAGLRPDVAILAAACRPNVDGEPSQRSMADFITDQVEVLRPHTVVLCHHDAWMPVLPALDPAPIAHELAARSPAARLIEMTYGDARPLLRR